MIQLKVGEEKQEKVITDEGNCVSAIVSSTR